MEEELRMQNFKDTMIMAGIDYELLSDMFDHTWELFNNVKQALQNNTKEESVLLDILNKENESNFIITHFKVRNMIFF